MNVFPKTRAAAGYAARHGPGELTRARAALLLARLDAFEDLLPGSDGHEPAAVCSLLRDLVLAAGDLAGPAWLQASSDDPDVAAFTGLQATASPPDPARIDEICSRVLWARFAPAGATQDGRAAVPAPGSQHPAAGTAPAPGRNAHRAVSGHRADIQQLSNLSSGFPGTGMAPGIPLTGCAPSRSATPPR